MFRLLLSETLAHMLLHVRKAPVVTYWSKGSTRMEVVWSRWASPHWAKCVLLAAQTSIKNSSEAPLQNEHYQIMSQVMHVQAFASDLTFVFDE